MPRRFPRPRRLGGLRGCDGMVDMLWRAANNGANKFVRPCRISDLYAMRTIDLPSSYQHIFGDGSFDVLLASHGSPFWALLFIAIVAYIYISK